MRPVWRFLALLALCFLAAVPAAQAHEIRPAYLQVREIGPDSYDVLWKVPRTDDTVLDIAPRFGPGFTLKETDDGALIEGFVVFHYHLDGEGPLPGSTLTIDGLGNSAIDVLAEIELRDGSRFSYLLQPTKASVEIDTEPSFWTVVRSYLVLGVEHILLGFDHLLFVFALILITSGAMRIVKTITAFTVAHSITLSVAALGYVDVPGPPVEATIALSIAFLALELLRKVEGKPTLTSRKPWLVAFIFGLLHGLGFAGALARIGLPQSAIPLALASFNVGVELGQLAFVAVVLVALRLVALRPQWPVQARRLAPYAIGSISMFWVFERLGSFA
ncbi:HupE/UreJ family protein [Altererythrobacter salegens]|uniref:HupE/UreJ family protein n=2 Tax=Croceibacterium salegens TaxID=1737568 RepID=A0A6I4SYX3_9SPHN|nr:HupE/UreJ family protein [Croceibacterium salegens]